MKIAFNIFLISLCITVLAWVIPWLYSLVFPAATNDPFVAFSPISESFIVSTTDERENAISEYDSNGNNTGRKFTREERDSLLPHIYYTQLVARDKLPDSLCNKEITIPNFKHSQWVFNSIPHDINKVSAEIYLLMESMPSRIELEDPKEAFRLNEKMEIIDIATNTVNTKRSSAFTNILKERGFAYPAKHLSANITTRKPYDEGYLIIDNENQIYHVKMQAGQPYVVKINQAAGMKANYVFILENTDTRHLGLVTDTENNLYVLERDGYRLKKLDVGKISPEYNKLTIIKNLFNWIVKISDSDGARWIALNSDDYSRLGSFENKYRKSTSQAVASYIFPFELTFTSTSDCFAKPRIMFNSWLFIGLNIILTIIVILIYRHRGYKHLSIVSITTLIFGVYAFIPFLFIHD